MSTEDETKTVTTVDVDLEAGGGVTNPGFQEDDSKDRKEKEAESNGADQPAKPVVITAGKPGTQAATGGVESGYRRVEPSAPVEKKSKKAAGAGLVCLLILLLILVIILLAVFLTGDRSTANNAITPSPAP